MSEISKVSFKFPTVKCAELAVKMKNDNARKQQFFQAVAEAYLSDDELWFNIFCQQFANVLISEMEEENEQV